MPLGGMGRTGAIWVVTTLPAVPPVRKQKSIAFSMLSPTATCGYVGDPKGGGIPPEQNTAALNDGAKVRCFFDNGDP